MKRNNSEKNNRGLVLTLIPTPTQKLLLNKHLNDTRFVYNQYVEEYLKALKEERIPNYKDYKELCTEYEFLKDSYSWTVQQVLYKFKQVNKINRSKRSKGKIVCESFISQSNNANVLFYDSFDFDADKWYIMNIKHEQKGIYECSIYNENYKELYNKTQNSNHEINYHSDKIILGNDVDFVFGIATLQIDLSETYFKNGDTIISEWNL